MKTLIIWNDFEDLAKFKLVVDDLSHLDNTMINCAETDEEVKKETELLELIYYSDSSDKAGEYKIDFEKQIPKDFNPTEHKQINVGFAP